MPSIAAAVRARRVDQRRRLLVGLASLFVGTLLVGLGAAGAVGTAVSPKTGVLVGGAAAVAGLVVLLIRAPAGERERTVGAAGAAIGLASLGGFWLLAPADVIGRPTATTVAAALGYCSGLAVVLASFLATATSADRRRDRPAGQSGVAWTRSRPRDDARGPAADGGEPSGARRTTSDERSESEGGERREAPRTSPDAPPGGGSAGDDLFFLLDDE